VQLVNLYYILGMVSDGSKNLQPGIHLANLVFFFKHLYFAKIVALLPCIEKNIGIHLNSKKYPWRRPWAWYVTRSKCRLLWSEPLR
jgi:hypothetical protein